MKRKPKKPTAQDDGRSFCNMNVEGMLWYKPESPSMAQTGNFAGDGEPDADRQAEMTSRERRAATRAYMSINLPRLITVVAAFVLAAVLVWLWLR